jgi:hypothetical protein
MCVYGHISKKSRVGWHNFFIFFLLSAKPEIVVRGYGIRYFIFEISGKPSFVEAVFYDELRHLICIEMYMHLTSRTCYFILFPSEALSLHPWLSKREVQNLFTYNKWLTMFFKTRGLFSVISHRMGMKGSKEQTLEKKDFY